MVRRLERLTARGGSAATASTAGRLCHSLPFRSHHLALVASLARLQDEGAFRFNEREGEDKDRLAKTLGSVAGRRLTYDDLTGKAVTERELAREEGTTCGPLRGCAYAVVVNNSLEVRVWARLLATLERWHQESAHRPISYRACAERGASLARRPCADIPSLDGICVV
jgi:hypothetical protein